MSLEQNLASMSFKKKSDYRWCLNFHGLGNPRREMPAGEQNFWVDPGLFAAVLDHVRDREDVQITVDDANESDYTVALPLLRERKLKASFFVVAGRIDQEHFLSKQQIKTLSAEGMSIGNHGLRHCRWKGMSQVQLEQELVTARDIIEQVVSLLRPTEAAPPPFPGVMTKAAALQMLRRQRYQRVYTSDGGVATPAAWIQPRNTIRRSHRMDEIVSLIHAPPGGAKRLWREFQDHA